MSQPKKEDIAREMMRAVALERLRSLGDMAGAISHEINQPLTGVRGIAEHILVGIERNWDREPEWLRSKLQRIIEQTDRIVDIVNHVRTLAAEAGKEETRPTQINDVLHAGLGVFKAQVRYKSIRVALELGEPLPLVQANPFSVEKMVVDLVLNAGQAIEEKVEGGGEADKTVRIRTAFQPDESGGQVRLDIIDAGVGMTAEVFERAFEPFFSTRGPARGAGLGLSLAKATAESQGGSLSVNSFPGRGTTVSIFFPALRAGEQRKEARK